MVKYSISFGESTMAISCTVRVRADVEVRPSVPSDISGGVMNPEDVQAYVAELGRIAAGEIPSAQVQVVPHVARVSEK